MNYLRTIRRFLICSVVACFIVPFSVAGATTYYVAKTGNDSNPGTQLKPWLTINKAANQMVAGDTVIVMAGTYAAGNGLNNQYYIPALNPANSGTAGNPITFKANPGDLVIVTGGGGYTPVIGSWGHDYIVWDGFTVIPDTGDHPGAYCHTTDHCTIKNCDLNEPYNDVNDNRMALGISGSTNAYIFNNKIHGARGTTTDMCGAATWNKAGIYMTGPTTPSQNNIIEHNEFYDNCVGIHNKIGGNGITIRYNLFHDEINYGIVLSDDGVAGSNFTIYQNIFYNTGNGIRWGTDSQTISNVQIYNNTFDNGPTYVGFSNIDHIAYKNSPNATVWNNIFKTPAASDYTIWVYSPTSTNAPTYENYNIFYGSTQFAWNMYSASTYYNTLSAWQSGTGLDANSITSNPLFVNSVNHDYHLQAGSLAWTSGRGGSYSSVIGAYITGNEIIGRVTSTSSTSTVTVKPSAPAGLVAR